MCDDRNWPMHGNVVRSKERFSDERDKDWNYVCIFQKKKTLVTAGLPGICLRYFVVLLVSINLKLADWNQVSSASDKLNSPLKKKKSECSWALCLIFDCLVWLYLLRYYLYLVFSSPIISICKISFQLQPPC